MTFNRQEFQAWADGLDDIDLMDAVQAGFMEYMQISEVSNQLETRTGVVLMEGLLGKKIGDTADELEKAVREVMRATWESSQRALILVRRQVEILDRDGVHTGTLVESVERLIGPMTEHCIALGIVQPGE